VRRIQISSGCASTFGLAFCLTGETSSFGKSRLDRLREELNEFAGPPYEALYRRWREQGDCVLGDRTRSLGQRSGGVASYRMDHDYELFGGLGRKIPA
jgi:hypothetical protein